MLEKEKKTKIQRLIILLTTFAIAAGICAIFFGGTVQAFGGYVNMLGKAYAQSDGVVVEGQNNPAVDIAAVQEAIDTIGEAGGGNVVLKGEFDFGAYGRVTITYDNVTLEGEKNGNKYKTIIKGGAFPVLVGQDLRVANYDVLDKAEIPVQDFDTYLGNPETVVPVSNIVVKDLHFEDPYFVGIGITGANGDINITGNKFTDGRPINDFWGYDYMAKAIVIWSGNDWDPSAITGDFLIKDNYIDGRYRIDPDDPDAKYVGNETVGYYLRGLDHGILAVTANATFTIKDNAIENVAEHGIYVVAFGGNMSATIKDNTIDNSYIGVPAIPTNESLTQSGILGAEIPGAHIADNTVNVEHPRGAGIVTFANEGVVIKDNQVHTEDANKAIGLEDDTYNSTVMSNKITGSGHAGIWLGWPGYANQNNAVEDNDLAGFTPTSGHDFFGIGAHWGAHIGLYWGASNNIIKNNKFSAVDPDDDDLSNVYFSGPFDDLELPGATANVLRAQNYIKVWDGTSDYNPYDPDTYNGDNDIELRHGD